MVAGGRGRFGTGPQYGAPRARPPGRGRLGPRPRRPAQRETGEPFAFEIMVNSRQQERLALNFAQGLQRIGVKAAIKLVDDVQYWRRLGRYEFDMIQWAWPASASPGNEQRGRWGSDGAESRVAQLCRREVQGRRPLDRRAPRGSDPGRFRGCREGTRSRAAVGLLRRPPSMRANNGSPSTPGSIGLPKRRCSERRSISGGGKRGSP